jgi:predicted MFS family arabinose efflux permease
MPSGGSAHRFSGWLLPAAVRVPLGLAGALVLVRFADETFGFFPAGTLAQVRTEVGLSFQQAGLLLALLGAGGVLGSIFEVAADHVSRRLLASLGAFVYAAAMVAFGLGHSFAVLAGASFVWGAASDAFVHGAEVALVDVAGGRLTSALGRQHAFASAGDVLSPILVAAALGAGLGWRPLFLAGGITMVGYAFWLSRQPLPPPHPRDVRGRPLPGVMSALRDPRILILGLAVSVFGPLDEPFLGFLIIFLQKIRGVTPSVANLVAAAVLAGGLVGYTVTLRLATGRSGRAVLVAASLVVLITVAGMVMLPDVGVVAVLGLGFGAGGAIFWTVVRSIVLRLRPGQAGTTSAVVSAIGLPAVAFPALVGTVADWRGLDTAMGLYVVLPAVMLLLVLLLLRFQREVTSA